VLPEALAGLGAASPQPPDRVHDTAEFNREEAGERLADALRLESGDAGVLLLAGSPRTVADRESMDDNPEGLASLAQWWRECGRTIYWWIPAVGEGPAARWRRERAMLLAADMIVGPSRMDPTGEAPSGWRWARRSITDPTVKWRAVGPMGQLAVVRRPWEVSLDDVRTFAPADRKTIAAWETEAHWEAG
jgi:hypothetical protein